jgi:hypothetical protein
VIVVKDQYIKRETIFQMVLMDVGAGSVTTIMKLVNFVVGYVKLVIQVYVVTLYLPLKMH